MTESIEQFSLKRRIITGAVFVIAVGVILLATITFVPRSGLNQVVQSGNDTNRLRERSAEFAADLKQVRTDRIYQLFNSSFRAEVTRQELDTAIREWVAGRRVLRVGTTHIEVYGLQGLVSTDVMFDARRGTTTNDSEAQSYAQEFLFQSWVLTGDGWQLLWLNKIMDPLGMDYGRLDTASMEGIIQLALDTLITGRRIEKHLGLSGTPDLVVLLDHGTGNFHVSLPNRKVAWLPRDSILKLRGKLDIAFYIDIQPLRILKDVAMGSLDVIPLADDSTAPRRRRGEKLLFVRKHGKWSFADYGASW